MKYLVAIPRDVAQRRGMIKYVTNVLCKNGHFSERKVGNGCCIECSLEWTRRWRSGIKPGASGGKELPDIEFLRECFYIKDNTLYWNERPAKHFNSERSRKVFTTRFPHTPAGYLHKNNGYIEVRLDGKLYKAHRIIYKLLTGVEPVGIVDHVDGDVYNNSLANLRLASPKENARNSKKSRNGRSSVFKGVIYNKGRWISSVTNDDMPNVLYFDTELEAALDYHKRAAELFGDFYRVCPNLERYLTGAEHD